MSPPRILALSGSTSAGSPSSRLTAAFVRELVFLDAEATRISLADYPLPLYDADEGGAAVPLHASRLRTLFRSHSAVFIATPEVAGSMPALLKNLLDWLEPRAEAPTRPAPIFAVASISADGGGGRAALDHLRAALADAFGGFVIGGPLAITEDGSAFDDKGRLDAPKEAAKLQALARELVHASRRLAPEFP